jgi:hypothetical protein
MANLNIGEAAALSPAMNFDLATPVMKGVHLGMQEKAAQAKALAASLKKNKILSLDTSGIHPTLRGDVEKLAYETTAQMKMAADAGEDPMSYKNLGQQKINEIQSESKRRFDLEKSDPNKYVMDQDVMSLFSQGKTKEAEALMDQKGYDPELKKMINPTTTLFLPQRINIQKAADEKYGYNTNPGLYVAGESQNIGPFGKKRVIMKLNDQAANAAALEMAGNTDVQATIMKDYSSQFKTELAKVALQNPGADPSMIRGKAFYNVIRDDKNKLLPTGDEFDEPKKGFNINVGTGDNTRVIGRLTDRDIHLKNTYGSGSYQKQKEFAIKGKVFSLNPQKVGMPPADLIPTSGKGQVNDVGAREYKSAYVTSLPINNSDTPIIIRHKGKDFATIKPGEVVEPRYLNLLKENRDKISFKPVALYIADVNVPGAGKVTKSYYTNVSLGDTNIFSDSEVKSGQQEDIMNGLDSHSESENKRYGIGAYANAPAPRASSKAGTKTTFDGVPKNGFN